MRWVLCAAILIITSYGRCEDSLKIVSWNVFLRPSILNDGQMDRVHGISNYLISTEADVLVLQELFHYKARKQLVTTISKVYPYHTKVGKTSFFGVSSGVMIFSKTPICEEEHIYFKRAIKADRLAVKGGVLATIEYCGSEIDIIGTHLQAGGGEKGAHIRKEQLRHLFSLVRRENRENRNTVFAGDFNISHDSENYTFMLDALESENHQLDSKILHTANFSDHSLYPTEGRPKWIDFILMRKNGTLRFHRSRIEQPNCPQDIAFKRLSDHNPIMSVLH